MDMISLPIEIDREKIDSRYRFVIAVAQRAKQLNQGSIPTKKTKARKITTVALEEVTCCTVNVLSGEEAVRAREKAEQSAVDQMLDEAGKKKTHVEDMTALEIDVRGFLKQKRAAETEYYPWED